MSSRIFGLIAFLTLGSLLLAGCDSSDDETVTPTPGSSGSGAMGPGISLAEALASDLDGPLLVNGFIVAGPDDVRLCEALAESLPPLCSGQFLVVEGLDLASIDGMEDAQGVSWTNDLIQVLGSVDGGTLVVDSLSSG